ncbi:MAG: hypothetical protein PUB22_04440 [Clostridiales bacterium]|nr:hypothetical protein [Clostridiales bacterium]
MEMIPLSYVYDLFDRLVEEKYNRVVKYRYEYYGEGDLVRKREVDASGNTVETVLFEYDSLGRLIRSRNWWCGAGCFPGAVYGEN